MNHVTSTGNDLNNVSWSTGIIMLILTRAVLLPPLLEEPVARGYMFHRLKLAYGVFGAIMLSAIIFVFSHGHFSTSDPVVVAQIACSLFSACCWAFATWQTGSIIPAIVGHALLNSPEPADSRIMIVIVINMIAISAAYYKSLQAATKQFIQIWRETNSKSEIIITGLGLALVMVLGNKFRVLIGAVCILSVILFVANFVLRKPPAQSTRQ